MKKLLLIFVSFLVLSATILLFQNRRVVISRHELVSPKLPETFDGFTIAQVSDFHNCSLGKRVLKKLRKEQPDIIVITGDFIDAHTTNTKRSLDFARQALTIAPVYYVSGNHESCIRDYPVFKKDLKEMGVHVLDNQMEEIGNGTDVICLSGINDPDFLQVPYQTSEEGIKQELDSLAVEKSKYQILLSHRPEAFPVYTDYDLVFTGHAHGGQFRLPFIGGLYAPNQGFFPKYDKGKYQNGTSHMIVSRGIGNSVIPVRINNSPEVVIAKLYKEKKRAKD